MAFVIEDDSGTTTAKPERFVVEDTKGGMGTSGANTGSSAADVGLDAGNAVGTGFWRGALRNVAGLLPDAAYNVRDLAKAAVGAPYTAITGKTPDALQIGDRSKDPLSGDWFVDQARKTKATRALVDPANPAYEGGYLQAMGGGASGVLTPGALPRSTGGLLGITTLGGTGAATGKLLGDTTGNPAWAVTGSLLPSGGAHYTPTLAQAAALGVKPSGITAAQRDMAQRRQDLANAGVTNPTLGLATGNTTIGGIENVLSNSAGSAATMQRSRQNTLNELQGTTDRAAALAANGRPTGRTPVGEAISEGVGTFRDDFKARQGQLYQGRLSGLVPDDSPVNMQGTLDTLGRLNAPAPGFRNTSLALKNPGLLTMESNLRADLASHQPAGGGLMNAPQPAPLAPWALTKGLRTSIGEAMADNPMDATVPRKMLSPVYGAMSGDMRAAAQATGGQPGLQAFNRATNYTTAGLNRLGTLESFESTRGKPQAPEAIADRYTALAGNKGELSTLEAVKKSLPEGVRGQAAGTVIESMGRALPGQNNAGGDVWSSERFLTNYGKMDARARDALFSGFPNAAEVRSQVDAVAKATSMMRDNSRLWANPSGTSGANAARSLTERGITALTYALGGNYGAARAVTSPRVLNAVQSRNPVTSYGLLAPQMGGLVGSGLLSREYD